MNYRSHINGFETIREIKELLVDSLSRRSNENRTRVKRRCSPERVKLRNSTFSPQHRIRWFGEFDAVSSLEVMSVFFFFCQFCIL